MRQRAQVDENSSSIWLEPRRFTVAFSTLYCIQLSFLSSFSFFLFGLNSLCFFAFLSPSFSDVLPCHIPPPSLPLVTLLIHNTSMNLYSLGRTYDLSSFSLSYFPMPPSLSRSLLFICLFHLYSFPSGKPADKVSL